MNTQGLHTARIDSSVPVQVSGWLLVLCLMLTFVYPATSFYSVFSHTIPKMIDVQISARGAMLSAYFVLFIALGALSFVAGLRLWLIKPGAVSFARRFLLASLFGNIAYFVLWILIVRPSHAASFAEMGWYHVVAPLPSVVLWYSYLEHSKRVRATYPLG